MAIHATVVTEVSQDQELRALIGAVVRDSIAYAHNLKDPAHMGDYIPFIANSEIIRQLTYALKPLGFKRQDKKNQFVLCNMDYHGGPIALLLCKADRKPNNRYKFAQRGPASTPRVRSNAIMCLDLFTGPCCEDEPAEVCNIWICWHDNMTTDAEIVFVADLAVLVAINEPQNTIGTAFKAIELCKGLLGDIPLASQNSETPVSVEIEVPVTELMEIEVLATDISG